MAKITKDMVYVTNFGAKTLMCPNCKRPVKMNVIFSKYTLPKCCPRCKEKWEVVDDE